MDERTLDAVAGILVGLLVIFIIVMLTVGVYMALPWSLVIIGGLVLIVWAVNRVIR